MRRQPAWATFAVENTHTHPRLGEYVHMTADEFNEYVSALTRAEGGERPPSWMVQYIRGTPIWLDGNPPAWVVRAHYDKHKNPRVRRIRAT